MADERSLEEAMLGKSKEDAEQDHEALSLEEISEGNFPRPANKQLPRLHIMTKDGTIHSMVNYHLDSNATFKGGEFVLLFVGAKYWQVRVKGSGKKFWKVFDYITLHRWPFIVESVRGVGDENAAVFTEISITDVTPKLA